MRRLSTRCPPPTRWPAKHSDIVHTSPGRRRPNGCSGSGLRWRLCNVPTRTSERVAPPRRCRRQLFRPRLRRFGPSHATGRSPPRPLRLRHPVVRPLRSPVPPRRRHQRRLDHPRCLRHHRHPSLHGPRRSSQAGADPDRRATPGIVQLAAIRRRSIDHHLGLLRESLERFLPPAPRPAVPGSEPPGLRSAALAPLPPRPRPVEFRLAPPPDRPNHLPHFVHSLRTPPGHRPSCRSSDRLHHQSFHHPRASAKSTTKTATAATTAATATSKTATP